MKSKIILGILFSWPLLHFGQQVQTITTLNKIISETSGLIYLNGKLITHNDSGGQPALYEIDSINGEVLRTVIVRNAINVDWEDICIDSNYIYVGDIGNNNGNRTNLKVYRIAISEYMVSDSVFAETIPFSYADQTNFSSAPFSTNFDAEALIAYNDSLYIFTKNWGNNRANIYSLPKIPGTYSIYQVDNFYANGLITGADYNPETHTVVLTGAALIIPFIIEIKGFTGNQFSAGNRNRYLISVQDAVQIEGIAKFNSYQYYMTAELGAGGSATLYRLDTDPILAIGEIQISNTIFYPNPASNIFQIEGNLSINVKIYDEKGALQMISNDHEMDVSALSKGLYYVLIQSVADKDVQVGKLVVE